MKLCIKQRVFSWGDTYVMKYSNPAYELQGLLLFLAIDAANCDND